MWITVSRQIVWVVVVRLVRVFLTCRSYKFTIVGRGCTSDNDFKENNRILFTASSKRSCQHIENETADEGEVVAPSYCIDEDDKPVS